MTEARLAAKTLWMSTLCLAACSSSGTHRDPAATEGSPPDGPATPVAATEAVPATLTQALAVAETLDGVSLSDAYPEPAEQPLGYDATGAQGMELIQASSCALSEGELARLSENGFVISAGQQFPSFSYGYRSIYADDLPVFVSADSILDAVHRSFDAVLKQAETFVLIGELRQLLDGMRGNLASAALEPQMAHDADLYLAVAASLLSGTNAAPVAGAEASEIGELVGLARAASGHRGVKLFGVARDEDFSQFEPRGHYTDSAELSRYFEAMMWLGRVDLRIVETQGDGSQVFYRRQFDAAVALNALLGADQRNLWQSLDRTIGAFVGENDSMTIEGLEQMLSALEVSTLDEVAALTDQQIIDELVRGGWGAQRIASRIIIKGTGSEQALPLDRSFALFGQRYTVDSHVFVNVTYDRVEGRLMPKPLDVAFGALGNNAALPLLGEDLANASYAHGLAKTRALVDAHEQEYWSGSAYTAWLGALRALSPTPAPADAFLPAVTATDAWQRRILSTQLGSWSQLRHDTILYVKQSYTTGAVCEFPDAYVDPYPELFARLHLLAERFGEVVAGLPEAGSQLKESAAPWVDNLQTVASNLQKMAEDQQTGTPHAQELIDFINDAVAWDEMSVCGSVERTNTTGWYLRLFLNPFDAFDYDPTVADVHTQPTDAGGGDVGRILHVGTGRPRLMVMTVDTCQGPRAYAGLAFSYGERITENWERLTDTEWEQSIATEPFPDPEWMTPVFGQ